MCKNPLLITEKKLSAIIIHNVNKSSITDKDGSQTNRFPNEQEYIGQ